MRKLMLHSLSLRIEKLLLSGLKLLFSSFTHTITLLVFAFNLTVLPYSSHAFVVLSAFYIHLAFSYHDEWRRTLWTSGERYSNRLF
jgi:hypothetical protein